jgi:hypothetical protein
VNAPNPSQWRNTLTGASITLLASAIAIYIAVHLVEAVAPVLIGIATTVIVLSVAWILQRRSSSGW